MLLVFGTSPRCLTSPPVLLRDDFPGELLVQVLSSCHNVRLVDKFLPSAVPQHHLQLREIILAFQPTLVKQSPASDHVAGSRFAYFSLGITGRPRRIWLPFIRQIAYDSQVAFFTRHVSAYPRFWRWNVDLTGRGEPSSAPKRSAQFFMWFSFGD